MLTAIPAIIPFAIFVVAARRDVVPVLGLVNKAEYHNRPKVGICTHETPMVVTYIKSKIVLPVAPVFSMVTEYD